MDGEPLVSQFTEAVDAVVNQFRGQGLTMAEALGALALVHAKLINEAFSGDDGEEWGE